MDISQNKQTVKDLVGDISNYMDYEVNAVVSVVRNVGGHLLPELCHGRLSYCDSSASDKSLMLELEVGEKLSIMSNEDLYESVNKLTSKEQITDEIKSCHAIASHDLERLGDKNIQNVSSYEVDDIIRNLKKLDILVSKYKSIDK